MTTQRPSTLLDVFASAAGCAERGFRFLQGGAVMDGDPEPIVPYPRLVQRARAIAAHLSDLQLKGERAVLLYPPGQEYVLAFAGCVSAGVVAVPAYPPDPTRLERTLPRLLNIIDDADAGAILTIGAIRDMAGLLAEQAPGLSQKTWIATDEIDDARADDWRAPDVRPDDLAFLQYTSGSTGAPKGVMLSHANLLANLGAISDRFGTSSESVGMIWLPPYHDMGLIGGILSGFYAGADVVLMSPLDFLKRPISWLEAISRYRATTSGGPNFAFELCSRKVTEEERARLDLSTWNVAFTGAEPIRKETLDRFVDQFGPRGFRRSAYLPCYGLAEATLLVTGARTTEEPAFRAVQVDALAHGRVAEPRIRYDTDVELVEGGRTRTVAAYDVSKSGLFIRTEEKLAMGLLVQLRFEVLGQRFDLNAEIARFVDKGKEGGKGPGYGCRFLRGDPTTRAQLERRIDDLFVRRHGDDGGRMARVVVGTGAAAESVTVAIVQPDTGTRAWTDQLGEIWVAGPSVAQGYWRNDEVTQGTFRAYLSDTGEGPFLRTGDLGFFKDGELYIAGRIKDLIIIRGVNFYPQDLELSAEQSHPSIRPGCVAAFSVDLGGAERLVVVAEAERRKGGDRRGRGDDAHAQDRRGSDRRQERALPELPTPDAVDGPAEIAARVRRRIAGEHDVSPYAVLLVKPGSIPKTSSGKIQRHACRARFLSGTLEVIGESAIATAIGGLETAPSRADVLAQTGAERAAVVLRFLRCAVVDVTGLQLDDASASRPLFELGVDSLAAAHLCHLVEERLHVPIALTSLLQGTTLQRIAERIAERVDAPADASGPASVDATADVAPSRALSVGQEGLLLAHVLAPDSAQYNEGAALRVLSALAPAQLQEAIGALTTRHPVLRTTYHVDGGQLSAKVVDRIPIPFEVRDARGLSEADLGEAVQAELERPFRLDREPPMRVAWFRTPHEPVLVVVFHHVAVDLWSIATIVRELASLLEGDAAYDA
jgi:acyl-CoA synthetase (AMP-forming)/AMP-acid ligase II